MAGSKLVGYNITESLLSGPGYIETTKEELEDTFGIIKEPEISNFKSIINQI